MLQAMREVGGQIDRGGLEGEERCLGRRPGEEVGAFGGLVAFLSVQVHPVIIQQLAADQGETLGLASLKVPWP